MSEWVMLELDELLYTDRFFSDCQIAIETLCLGCPNERGWSFANDDIPDPQGTACEHMVDDVQNLEHPCVMMRDEKPYCVYRYEIYDLPEIEKYERRMRGDWS